MELGTDGHAQADETRIRELALGAAVAAALQAAARIGVADALDDVPRSAEDLAKEVDAQPGTLARLLRTLAAHGVFAETSERDTFEHTRLSRMLRTDAPDSMVDMVLWAGAAWTWQAWPLLHQAVRSGQAVVPGLYGKPFFRYLKEDGGQDAAVFNRAMTQASALTSESVAEALDVAQARTIADIGGGQGHLLRTVLEKNPGVEGVLFDLPEVVTGADAKLTQGALSARTRVIAGDCVESVPVEADVYLIKQILKWDDERSVRVLRNVAEHARPGARIVVVQNLVDVSPEPKVTTAMDLFLLLNVGGREHRREEFEELFHTAGLDYVGVKQARSALYLIEAAVPGKRPAS